MYYGHMSKEDIRNSSRPFLYGVYKKYVKRACENLGVYSEPNDGSETQLKESDYPKEFKKLTKKERKDFSDQFSGDEDFLSGFSGLGFKRNKFVNEKTFADKRETTEV